MYLSLADSGIQDLKDIDKLDNYEQEILITSITIIQNYCGDELRPVLDKFNLEWKG